MKVLCISDTEMPQLENAANLRRQYSDIDLIISCGDLPPAYLDFHHNHYQRTFILRARQS